MEPHVDESKWELPGWLKLLLIVAAVAILAIGLLQVFTAAATARWERYADRLRAGGVPLTFAEIEAHRTQSPAGQTAARLLEELSGDLEAARPGRRDMDRDVLVFGRGPETDLFFDGIPRYRVEPTREFLAQHRELLDRLRLVTELPPGRFNLVFGQNALAIFLPQMTPVRSAAKLVYLDGVINLTAGDLEGAAAEVRVHSRISATLDEHPTVVGRLVQINVDSHTRRTIENVLRVGSVSDSTLVELGNIVDERMAATTMKWAFVGERALIVDICSDLLSGTLSLTELNNGVSPTPGLTRYLPDLLIRESQMWGVEMLTRLVDAGDDPQAMTKAARQMDAEIPALPFTQVVVRMTLPSLSRAVILHLRITAELRCARLALAAERFRLATGRLPGSLEELVPSYVDAVPLDPFDGQPMRFAKAEKGIVIYSIDEDLTDDGGVVTRQKTRPHFRDVGFRLFEPEHRGLLLTDEPPPDDD